MNRFIWLAAILLLMVACNSTDNTWADVYIEESITEFETITYDNESDTFYSGDNGSVIVFPANAWLDENGNPYQGNVKVKLVEAISDDQILLQGLSTVSNLGEMLESGGMVYVSATGGNQRLVVNPKNGPVVSIPTENFDPEMKHYHGVLGEDSVLRWEEEKEIKSYLKTIPWSELNFRTETFDKLLMESLPIGNINEFNSSTADSLFAASIFLTESIGMVPDGMTNREAQDSGYIVIDTITGAVINFSASAAVEDTTLGPIQFSPLGCIIPTKAMSIKNKKFENTFFATKAFEARYKALLGLCENAKYLEVYGHNLHRDLYICDSMVMEMIPDGSEKKAVFESFYKEGLTNVEHVDPDAQHLSKALNQLSKSLEAEIHQKQKELRSKQIDPKKKKRLQKELKRLDWKREKSYMRRYNYRMTKNGWQNVDKPLTVAAIEKAKKKGVPIVFFNETRINIKVTNAEETIGLQAYLSFPESRSILRLKNNGNNEFYSSRSDNQFQFPLSIGIPVKVIIFTPNEDQSVYLESTITPDSSNQVDLNFKLEERNYITYEDLRLKLKSHDRYHKRHQSLGVDLEIHKDLNEIKQQENNEREVRRKLKRLHLAANTCCFNKELQAFETHCASCHKMDRKFIGPAMFGSIKRWKNRDDLIEFIQSSVGYLKNHPEDEYAEKLMKDYNQSVMTPTPLTEFEIERLLQAVEYLENNPSPTRSR